MSLLLGVLLVLLIFSLIGGAWTYSGVGYLSFSPFGVLLAILLLLLLLGIIRL